MGHFRLAGGTFSIWISSRAVSIGGGVPNRAAQGKPVPLDSSIQNPSEDRLILPILLMTTLTKLTHQALPLQRVDSSASHAGRECLMRLMGSSNICCTPSQACSAPSTGG